MATNSKKTSSKKTAKTSKKTSKTAAKKPASVLAPIVNGEITIDSLKPPHGTITGNVVLPAATGGVRFSSAKGGDPIPPGAMVIMTYVRYTDVEKTTVASYETVHSALEKVGDNVAGMDLAYAVIVQGV